MSSEEQVKLVEGLSEVIMRYAKKKDHERVFNDLLVLVKAIRCQNCDGEKFYLKVG
jgi:hypothetical protein